MQQLTPVQNPPAPQGNQAQILPEGWDPGLLADELRLALASGDEDRAPDILSTGRKDLTNKLVGAYGNGLRADLTQHLIGQDERAALALLEDGRLPSTTAWMKP